ncbi:MAG: lysylphosphatidylglycerol synthase transmembrane domain-containing protein [Mariprofundaceae bacterium]
MLWIKVVLSVLLLVCLVATLDLSAIFERLETANWTLIAAAVLCLFVGQLMSAIRWTWLARGLGLTVDTLKKIKIYFMGMFLSLFLPSIIGGDVARGWLLARGKDNAGWPAAASVILERINGVVGLMLLVSCCMFFLDLPLLWVAFWNAGLLLLFIILLTTSLWWPRLVKSGWSGKFSGWKELQLTTPAFQRAWWTSLPISIVFQILVVQTHVFLGMAIGMELSWFAYGFIVCLVGLASALPISFNGFGIRETGYVSLAVWFGASADAAGAMAALWVLVLLITAAPGGILLWQMGGTKILQQTKPEP